MRHGGGLWKWSTQRGLRAQPKVAITLRRDEHLSVDIHQQKQGPVVSSQGIAKTSRLLTTDDCKLTTAN